MRMVGKQIRSLRASSRPLLARFNVNQIAKGFGFHPMPRLAEALNSSQEHRQLRAIAVDLTPILPGGENGGAKIFVVELLRQLGKMMPEVNFILLTQAASHLELSALDRANMRRRMVVGSLTGTSSHSFLKNIALRVLPHLPSRLSRIVSRVGYKLSILLKRSSTGTTLRDMHVDLLFCPFTAPTFFELGIPTVCTIYDLQYKTYPEFFSVADAIHRDRTFMDACRRATALTAISDYSRNSAIAHGKLDPNKIRTIYLRMGQRIMPESEPDQAVVSRLGLCPQEYLLYPANFWKHKNHEMLLTAFGIACSGGLASKIKLVCTGAPGERQQWLMRAARNMNLGDRIIFPGYLPKSELAALMANCAGVVFPSLYEGFGLPVIEAMAAGVPVACSNTTSLPEVAADSAILFDPRVPTQIAQAMLSIVENETLRAQMIEEGKQRAIEFSDPGRMASEYWELFQYAFSNEKQQENLLTGAYADGWVGPRLTMQAVAAKGLQTFEIDFSAPEWLPKPHITIQACRGGKPQGSPLVLDRGTKVTLSLPIDPKGTCYEFKISPTFVPARAGYGDDLRELTVLLHRCSIKFDEDDSIELFPEILQA